MEKTINWESRVTEKKGQTGERFSSNKSCKVIPQEQNKNNLTQFVFNKIWLNLKLWVSQTHFASQVEKLQSEKIAEEVIEGGQRNTHLDLSQVLVFVFEFVPLASISESI